MKEKKKEIPDPVTPPSGRERFTLRCMIVLGVCSMVYFLYCLFQGAQIGYAPFYWVLMAGITFNCLRLLHEWYHYFDIVIPEMPPQEKVFTVDIFTTFCPGEPYEMIVETLRAIQRISYPHTTYLCDEANDPYLIGVCQQLGVHHVTRTNRINAKAGNINNALQYATGELCVIMDPDHVPSPDFLDHIVSHFNDPKVGFVQIVQAYSNLGDNLIAKGAAQQTFQFYGPIMSTMNSYGTVLAIGANCTFRRAALDSIGGHAAGLAEDMHTAMQLHAKGWHSVYVPKVLTRGLVPNTLAAYYSQQLKWARGTFELLITSYPKLFRHFTWKQRLHYGTIPFHYFSGIIFFINFLVPILSLFTGLIPFRLDMLDFFLLAMPLVASLVLIRHYVQRWVMEEEERGFHIVGGLLFIGTWWIFIVGLVYTIIRKKVPYIPTPKDDSQPDDWKLYVPNILVLLASLSAMMYGLWFDWNPYSLVMAGIAGINCVIMMFNIMAGLRLRRKARVTKLMEYPDEFKRQLWLFRHHFIYMIIRKVGLPLLLIVVALTWFFTAIERVVHPVKETAFYPPVKMHTPPVPAISASIRLLPEHIRGLNYHKGENWFRNLHALTRRQIAKDLQEMKALGVNTIRRFGPGVYDRNILSEAANAGMNVNYGFWISSARDLDKLEKKILHSVKELKAHPRIVAWSIGNAAWEKPAPQSYYLQWLQTLLMKIRKEDPSRPVTVDVHLEKDIDSVLQQLHRILPADAFGITITQDTSGLASLQQTTVPYFISEMPVNSYVQLPEEVPAFVSSWQDLETRDFVTFDGLTDHTGRYKPAYYTLAAYWGRRLSTPALPEIRILRPARGTFPGDQLSYHALVRSQDGWKIPAGGQFEWYLVKTDDWGNAIAMKRVGAGVSVTFPIPDQPDTYRLYLETVVGNSAKGVQSVLNTPLSTMRPERPYTSSSTARSAVQ